VADVGGHASGGVVMAAAEVSDITATTERLRKLLLITGLAAVALASALTAVLIGRGLLPLRRLSHAAAQIERTGDPSRRLPEASSADEIAELTSVLNGMLAALEAARASERRFLADASHELRTPIAALAGNLEYAQRHGTDSDVLADLRHDTARLARLVDQLLLLERQHGAAPVDERVDLAQLANEAVEGSERAATGKLDHVEVHGDRDALARALANLIENALVHGPEGGQVRVDVHAGAGSARVAVGDEGPGPTAEEQATCSSASGAATAWQAAPARDWDCRSWRPSRAAITGRSRSRARRSRSSCLPGTSRVRPWQSSQARSHS
jgi:two-component system OmpR family sensor kinase